MLHFVAADREVIIPESVEREVREQSHEIHVLQGVLDADWIAVDRSDDLEFLATFARYENHLVVGTKNRGECGVLALAKVRGYEAVLDDGAARQLAQDDDIQVTATLNLLCQAIQSNQLTVALVEHVADELIRGYYYLPFLPGGFRRWAIEEGHIDYE